jgi:hypothetical protein
MMYVLIILFLLVLFSGITEHLTVGSVCQLKSGGFGTLRRSKTFPTTYECVGDLKQSDETCSELKGKPKCLRNNKCGWCTIKSGDSYTSSCSDNKDNCDMWETSESLKKGCQGTTYGCCPDGMIPRADNFGSNCVFNKDAECNKSDLGCCSDGVTPKVKGEDCPKPCNRTRYGCCPGYRITKKDRKGTNCPKTISDTLFYTPCEPYNTENVNDPRSLLTFRSVCYDKVSKYSRPVFMNPKTCLQPQNTRIGCSLTI